MLLRTTIGNLGPDERKLHNTPRYRYFTYLYLRYGKVEGTKYSVGTTPTLQATGSYLSNKSSMCESCAIVLPYGSARCDAA
jgi:hypothetical protein